MSEPCLVREFSMNLFPCGLCLKFLCHLYRSDRIRGGSKVLESNSQVHDVTRRPPFSLDPSPDPFDPSDTKGVVPEREGESFCRVSGTGNQWTFP